MYEPLITAWRPFVPRGHGMAMIVAAIAGSLWSCIPITGGAAEPMIEIVQAVWTTSVDKQTKTYSNRLSSTTTTQPLFLWTRIRAGKEALSLLEAQGNLPIKHKWFKETISSVSPEGVLEVTDEITVPAARRTVIDSLRSSIQNQGHFIWRTWSMKDNIGRGTWRVKIVYADNTPVICNDAGVSKACEFLIKVK